MEGVPASILQSALNVKVKFLTITRQVFGRPVCDRVAIPENEKLYAHYAVVFQL